jgi:hypothetical protein
MFSIQLPNLPHLVYARLGDIVMRDPDHMIFVFLTDHPDSPALILVTRDGRREFADFTRLILNPYAGMDLTFINVA